MKLTLTGHDDLYAVEQLQMALFGNNAQGEAESRLYRSGTYCTAATTITYNGRTAHAARRFKAQDESVRLRRQKLQQSYYAAAIQLLPKLPPWGALSGVRPTKITTKHLLEGGTAIIKGAQGTTGVDTISTFTAGFVLIMITLIIVLNLVRSRSGRAILACRDNRIAAESVGIDVTKYKMMAFVVSASLAGAAGALYGLNYSSLVAAKFDFNTSILVLVFVVLGGLGKIWGSIIAAAVLYILPEALRSMADLRMLIYAIVLIAVMLATNSPSMKNLLGKLLPKRKEME